MWLFIDFWHSNISENDSVSHPSHGLPVQPAEGTPLSWNSKINRSCMLAHSYGRMAPQSPEQHYVDSLKLSSDGWAPCSVWQCQAIYSFPRNYPAPDALLSAFVLLGLSYNLAGAAPIVKGVPRRNLPVVKHTLWAALATGVGAQIGCETKGLIDRQ